MENTNTLQSFVVAHYRVLKKCFPEFFKVFPVIDLLRSFPGKDSMGLGGF